MGNGLCLLLTLVAFDMATLGLEPSRPTENWPKVEASGGEAPRPGADDPAARAALDAWLSAQNRGDFAAYRAYYSSRFRGVRRSRDRAVALDYQEWMRDRARMFGKPMTVKAEQVSCLAVEVFGLEIDGARVDLARRKIVRCTFLQTFSSGRFADRGTKRVEWARGSTGELRIVAEEMLDSKGIEGGVVASGTSPLSPPGAAPPPDPAPAPTAAAPAGHPPANARNGCPAGHSAPVTTTFRGEPAWLVLGGTSASLTAANARANKLRATGIEAEPVATDLFLNLRPGLYAIVLGAYPTREEATARTEALTAQKITTVVKESGKLRSGQTRPLVRLTGRALFNANPQRLEVSIGVEDPKNDSPSPLVSLTSDANGTFVWWTDVVGDLEIIVEPGQMRRHDDSSSRGDKCLNIAADTRGSVDAGDIEADSWFCGE